MDIIARDAEGVLMPVVIEVNGRNSGGLWHYDEYQIGKKDNKSVGPPARLFARTMFRRALEYKRFLDKKIQNTINPAKEAPREQVINSPIFNPTSSAEGPAIQVNQQNANSENNQDEKPSPAALHLPPSAEGAGIKEILQAFYSQLKESPSPSAIADAAAALGNIGSREDISDDTAREIAAVLQGALKGAFQNVQIKISQSLCKIGRRKNISKEIQKYLVSILDGNDKGVMRESILGGLERMASQVGAERPVIEEITGILRQVLEEGNYEAQEGAARELGLIALNLEARDNDILINDIIPALSKATITNDDLHVRLIAYDAWEDILNSEKVSDEIIDKIMSLLREGLRSSTPIVATRASERLIDMAGSEGASELVIRKVMAILREANNDGADEPLRLKVVATMPKLWHVQALREDIVKELRNALAAPNVSVKTYAASALGGVGKRGKL